ncbi:helix-turn-helix domain-containing protein [Umezawaea sp. Da 62-37]|uniref:MarR family winged helix-turn-helix transcriptional regulator n=1 Tax=Umezawaea sp. Da 62-37 TaxID=3075927 RepID=UPI0028F6D991|nr:helix-turn-helix domain-containing protein [Umezawaea sp. Da 62-37]WNV89097.1 helix-turn-helix domain-containing protein [Umezawaea sp. Da 62-37]
MAARTGRTASEPDLGVLAGRLLSAVRQDLFTTLAEKGFTDLRPRHGTVLAHLSKNGVRATDLSRLSGVHKQVIGTVVDELERLGYVERRPDPADRRAKLILPTGRGLAQMRAAAAFMAAAERRHARRLGPETYARFKLLLDDVAEHQRRRASR